MLLRTIVFLSGAVLMALEMVGSRVLAPYFGNSIFVWGSLIGVFLAALTAGYYIGGVLADLRPNIATLAGCLLLAGLLVVLVPETASPVNSWLNRRIVDPRLGSLLATLILFAPASVLLGVVSPYAIRLQARSLAGVGSTAGVLYALSTAGSIVGTFAASFYLIPTIGVKSILYILGAALLGLSVLGYVASARHLRAVAVSAVAVLALLGANYAGSFEAYNSWGDVIFETDTLYHHLVVVDHDGIRYMKFDNSLQSAMYLDRPGETPFEYIPRMALGCLFAPDAKRALLIGLGAGSLPKLLHSPTSDIEFDVAEIDPTVIRTAMDYFDLKLSPGLNIVAADGRDYMRTREEGYDIVFLDAYYADSIPFHLTTQEFLEEVKGHLQPGGVVVANVIGSFKGDSSRLFRAMYKTFSSVFPQVYAFSEVGVEPDVWQNIIVVATADTGPLTVDDLVDLASSLPDRPAGISPDELASFAEALYTGPITIDDVPLLTDDYAPLDSLLNVYGDSLDTR